MNKKYLENRIEYTDDNHNYLGHLAYQEDEHVLTAISTVVDKKARGQGIARLLVLDFIALAKEKNKQIKPVCSYVVDFFEKNQEYQEFLIKD